MIQRPIVLPAAIALLLAGPAWVAAQAQSAGKPSLQKLFEWGESPFPEVLDLPTAERNAIFKAAGVQQAGGRWTGCPDDPSESLQAEVTLARDLNGDGRPEAVVLDNGTFCYGNAGVGSTVLTRTAAGEWQVLYANQGFVDFLTSRGTGGYPEIQAGLPGFCCPYFRWDGKEYEMIARLDEEGKACQPG